MAIIGNGKPARTKGREVAVGNPDFDPADPKQVERLKIAAQMYRDYTLATERLIQARGKANWRYLRLHGLAAAGIGLYLRLGVTPTRADVLNVGGIGVIVLLLVNVYWALHILSITRHVALKYRVIESMESWLPLRPQTAEWELLMGFLPRWMIELGLPLTVSAVWIIAYAEVWWH